MIGKVIFAISPQSANYVSSLLNTIYVEPQYGIDTSKVKYVGVFDCSFEEAKRSQNLIIGSILLPPIKAMTHLCENTMEEQWMFRDLYMQKLGCDPECVEFLDILMTGLLKGISYVLYFDNQDPMMIYQIMAVLREFLATKYGVPSIADNEMCPENVALTNLTPQVVVNLKSYLSCKGYYQEDTNSIFTSTIGW